VSAAEVVTTRPYSGPRCLHWRHGDSASISFNAAPGDWPADDTLTLWLRTDTPGGASFGRIIPSGNARSEGMGNYSAALSVQLGDWQRISLRLREDLTVNRSLPVCGGCQLLPVRAYCTGRDRGPRLTGPRMRFATRLPVFFTFRVKESDFTSAERRAKRASPSRMLSR
jgi:hypothetical protein